MPDSNPFEVTTEILNVRHLSLSQILPDMDGWYRSIHILGPNGTSWVLMLEGDTVESLQHQAERTVEDPHHD